MLVTASIPNELKSVLDEIAERLWSGHASVMIGAGFSKNATKNNPNSKPFLTWNELADVFYRKLHGKDAGPAEHYLNPLKLADELQAGFGRPALDQIIQSSLPDLEYSPSELHSKLLALPWNDVFTTNYDTLLERTDTTQKYDIVRVKEDLIYSQRPRIIKLHGSFSSHRPFIISEEDYRTYPREFAPFVNTVQQSLIENTLCLIGFSGEDPNFLNWLGWIRDNLGNSTSAKIYLVGAFTFSNSQIQLFEKRNIAVVNFGGYLKDNEKHKTAIESFLQYLRSKRVDESRVEWPENRSDPAPKAETDGEIVLEIREISKIWEEQRICYPGWVICPEDAREKIWHDTQYWIRAGMGHFRISLPFSVDLQFFSELCWRLDKCLSPLYENLVIPIENVVSRYNPYPLLNPEQSEFNPDQKLGVEADWQNFGSRWLTLMFSLLRHYREEQLNEKWRVCYQNLEKHRSIFSAEQKEQLNYELCLQHIFEKSIQKAKESIRQWMPAESSPFYKAKRAGLLAEIGDVSEATTELEASLRYVREQLNLKPITTDYSYLSEEAHILQSLSLVKGADWDKKNKEYLDQARRRWTYLRQYKCDPVTEIKLFVAKLSGDFKEQKDVEKILEFDIGSSSTKIHYGRDDYEIRSGYAYLRYAEDAGLPSHIPGIYYEKEAALGAIRRISGYSFNWAVIELLRLGDYKSVDVLFDRLSLRKNSYNQIEALCSSLIELLKAIRPDIEKPKSYNNQNIGSRYVGTILEVLSRLCTRSSIEIKRKLLSIVVEIYKSPYKLNYHEANTLTKRLVISWPKTHFPELISTILVKIPPVTDIGSHSSLRFPDPINFIQHQDLLSFSGKISISTDIIDSLIESFKSSRAEIRQIYFTRLLNFYYLSLLSDEQKKSFSDELWKYVDDTGFPSDLWRFSRRLFLNLPHSFSDEVIAEKYRSFILNLNFPTMGSSNSYHFGSQNWGAHEFSGSNDFLIKTHWSPTDARKLLSKIVTWWETDKKFLSLPKDNERRKDTLSKFNKVVTILASAVVPFLEVSELELDTPILALAKEMRILYVSTSELLAAIAIRNQSHLNSVITEISSEVYSDDFNTAVKGVIGLTILLESEKIRPITDNVSERILLPIVEAIKWRRLPALLASLANLEYIIGSSVDIWKKHLFSINFGLKCLFDETDLLNETSAIPISDRLHIREYATALARRLFDYYELVSVSIPQELDEWRKIESSIEEFDEIKNQWSSSILKEKSE